MRQPNIWIPGGRNDAQPNTWIPGGRNDAQPNICERRGDPAGAGPIDTHPPTA